MDSILAWMILMFGTWYGCYKFIVKIVEEEEARKHYGDNYYD